MSMLAYYAHRRTALQNLALRLLNNKVVAMAPSPGALDLTTAFDLSVRARRASATPARTYLAGAHAGAVENWAIIQGYNGNEVEWFGQGFRYSFGSVADDLYHRYRAWHDGSTLRLYLDGALSLAVPGAPFPVGSIEKIIIGAVGEENRDYWLGDIDYLRLRRQVGGQLATLADWQFNGSLFDSVAGLELVPINPVEFVPTA